MVVVSSEEYTVNVEEYVSSLAGRMFLGVRSSFPYPEEKIKEINSYKGRIICGAEITVFSPFEKEPYLAIYFDSNRKMLGLVIDDTIIVGPMPLKDIKEVTQPEEKEKGKDDDREFKGPLPGGCYQPTDALDKTNPPKGGSGVPDKK